jgi:hypothetical protein
LSFGPKDVNVATRASNKAKPFLKWAGGKARSATALAAMAPPFGGAYREPFMGSAALFFEVAPESAIISDANEELVVCFQEVARDPHAVMDLLDQMPNTKDRYLAVRAQDPAMLSEPGDPERRDGEDEHPRQLGQSRYTGDRAEITGFPAFRAFLSRCPVRALCGDPPEFVPLLAGSSRSTNRRECVGSRDPCSGRRRHHLHGSEVRTRRADGRAAHDHSPLS